MWQLHGEHGIAWRIDSATSLFWRGEATGLEEMLGNLLDNAGKWAGQQALVQARRDAGGLLVEIDDDGPGLSPEQLVRVRGLPGAAGRCPERNRDRLRQSRSAGAGRHRNPDVADG